MKYFDWDEAKNEKLKAERGIGFEEIVFLIGADRVLDILDHPNRECYAGQRIFVIERNGYAYLVPFVEDDRSIFLKTIIPKPQGDEAVLGRGKGRAVKLDKDEKEIIDSVERGQWRSAPRLKRERSRYVRYAKATFRKDRRVNIRISSRDLEAIQKRAIEEGLPYQTLISSLLHKYAAGRLRET